MTVVVGKELGFAPPDSVEINAIELEGYKGARFAIIASCMPQ